MWLPVSICSLWLTGDSCYLSALHFHSTLSYVCAESYIRDDIERCRDFTKSKNPSKLSSAVGSLAGRAKRAAKIAKNGADSSNNVTIRRPLHSAAVQLDRGKQMRLLVVYGNSRDVYITLVLYTYFVSGMILGANHMSSEGSKLIKNMDDKTQEKRFARSVREVHEGVQDVKNLLLSSGHPRHASHQPSSTSTPVNVPIPWKKMPHVTATTSPISHDTGSEGVDTSAPPPDKPALISSRMIKAEPRPQLQASPLTMDFASQGGQSSPVIWGERREHKRHREPVRGEGEQEDVYLHRAPEWSSIEHGIRPEDMSLSDDRMWLSRKPSFGKYPEGHSISHGVGEVETQTPLARQRDEEIQTSREKVKRSSPLQLAQVTDTRTPESIPAMGKLQHIEWLHTVVMSYLSKYF